MQTFLNLIVDCSYNLNLIEIIGQIQCFTYKLLQSLEEIFCVYETHKINLICPICDNKYERDNDDDDNDDEEPAYYKILNKKKKNYQI